MKKLYKEVTKSGKVLTPEEQECDYIMLKVISTECIEATYSEIVEAIEYFNKNDKCKIHLFYDEPSFLYYNRICGICKKHITLI